MKFIFGFGIWVLSLVSGSLYAQYSQKDFEVLHGLAGSWKLQTKTGWLYEHWYKVNDSTLRNKSYRVAGTDTIPQETVLLNISNGAITYTSTVANQNNQEPVSFILVSNKSGKYIFENKQHDFPQRINYQLIDKNTLAASISGTVKDHFREIPFNFQRIN